MSEKEYYIARVYTQGENFSQSIDAEGIYDSYESALQFLKEQCRCSECESQPLEGKAVGSDFPHELSEIVAYNLNCYDPDEYEKRWTFDHRLNLLSHYDAMKVDQNCVTKVINGIAVEASIEDPDPDSFSSKFKVGDIVFIRAAPWNPGGTCTDLFGVVGWCPVHLKEWTNDGNNKNDWDYQYRVYYILGGYLDHMHFEEKAMVINDKDIPDDLSFIKRLSDHFKGERPIPTDIYELIEKKDFFLEKVKLLPE